MPCVSRNGRKGWKRCYWHFTMECGQPQLHLLLWHLFLFSLRVYIPFKSSFYICSGGPFLKFPYIICFAFVYNISIHYVCSMYYKCKLFKHMIIHWQIGRNYCIYTYSLIHNCTSLTITTKQQSINPYTCIPPWAGNEMVDGQGSKTTNVVLGNDERGIDDNGGQSSAGPLKRGPSKHYLSGTCVSVRSRHRNTPFLVLPICVFVFILQETLTTHLHLSLISYEYFLYVTFKKRFTFTRSMCVFFFCMFSLCIFRLIVRDFFLGLKFFLIKSFKDMLCKMDGTHIHGYDFTKFHANRTLLIGYSSVRMLCVLGMCILHAEYECLNVYVER